MTEQTPNINLKIFKESDKSISFDDFRMDMAGDTGASGVGTSNMQKIDTAFGKLPKGGISLFINNSQAPIPNGTVVVKEAPYDLILTEWAFISGNSTTTGSADILVEKFSFGNWVEIVSGTITAGKAKGTTFYTDGGGFNQGYIDKGDIIRVTISNVSNYAKLRISLKGNRIETVSPPPQPTNTFYVSATTGNDNNVGSISSPFKTIQKAADVAKDKDTVQIRGGTYNERVIIKNSGIGNLNRLTFESYPGETVIIDGNGISLNYYEGLVYVNQKSNILFKDITIQNSQGMGFLANGLYNPRVNISYITLDNVRVLNTGDAGIRINYGTGIYVNNCYTKETGSSGIGIWSSNNVLVENNEVINARNLPMPQGHEECITISNCNTFEIRNNEVWFDNFNNYLGAAGIDIKNTSSDGSIHHNYVHDFYQDGAIYVDAWDGYISNINIYSNRVEHAGGITIGSERGGTVDGVNIYNNIVIDSAMAGIYLHQTGGNGLRKNINMYNNTIFRSIGNGGAGIYIGTTSIENIVIKNNLVNFDPKWVGQITSAYNDSATLSQITVDKNLTWGRTECSNTFPNCVELNNGTIRADPLFVNTSTLDLRIQASSPARDAGETIALVTNDIVGTSRPQGTKYDIGAYEYI